MLFIFILIATIFLSVATAQSVNAAETYDGGLNTADAPIRIRVGTGGAGQSGILKALADEFILQNVASGSDAFQISWIRSDTFVSIAYLSSNIVDIAITYNEVAEEIAIEQGVATGQMYYAWRDHFMLVGPRSNPANLTYGNDVTATSLFRQLYVAAQNSVNSNNPVRFLSRFDKSATNVKESWFWVQLSQTPWATAASIWYHQYIAFPMQALTAAVQLGEYTLTDRGTFLTTDPALTSQLTIFKQATDMLDDPLLNPAHILISASAEDPKLAKAFAEWIVQKGDRGGQQVIRTFARQGRVLYADAP